MDPFTRTLKTCLLAELQPLNVQLTVEQVGNVRVVQLPTPRMDFRQAEAIRDELFNAVQGQDCLLLDISSVGYMDVFGFELLLECMARCQGRVAVAGLSSSMESMVRLSQLSASLELYSEREAALAAIASA